MGNKENQVNKLNILKRNNIPFFRYMVPFCFDEYDCALEKISGREKYRL